MSSTDMAHWLQAEAGRGQEQPSAPSGRSRRGGRGFGRDAGFGSSGSWKEDGSFGGGQSMGRGSRRDDFGMDDLLMEVGCRTLLGVRDKGLVRVVNSSDAVNTRWT